MTIRIVLILIAILFALTSVGLLAYVFYFKKEETDFKSLMRAQPGFGSMQEARKTLAEDKDGSQLDKLKHLHRKTRKRKKTEPTLEELFYQAGYFTKDKREEFEKLRYIYPAVLALIMSILFYFVFSDLFMGFLGITAGALLGMLLPKRTLISKIAKRYEEIMYYLPLVIEQLAIGVSSSLDIGPCIQNVLDMAEDRDRHNVVTELLGLVQLQIRTGTGLPDALIDVGNRSNHAELKHTFMALAQVVRHGGEISKQLMELANSVSRQRESMIEAKIKKLELKATLPVAFVFFGFMIILLTAFGLQIMVAFK
jgi:Flp pilus assembly protein TadB